MTRPRRRRAFENVGGPDELDLLTCMVWFSAMMFQAAVN